MLNVECPLGKILKTDLSYYLTDIFFSVKEELLLWGKHII